ncbi:conserved hypothetical protein [uncultured Mycobacterium sp.]|uniref:Uncharacterized protein n=1 Tax=uncultured Mycobacterium sp. TaxID=171292 RepID=A0A1Y5PK26_9MYCO|nr:conserved hypothetical protein [uncultured Mycobacterium sp.]
MTSELIKGFEHWLAEGLAPDVSAFASHAQSFLEWRGDAQVQTIGEGDIRAFLLEWCPRHLSMPAEQSREVCDAVGEFLRYLGEMGRLRGGPEPGRKLATLAVSLADAMQTKMADPANYGMAKSLFAGIDGAEDMTEQELLAAMQRRVDEHNALPFEQRKALTDHVFDRAPSTVELPFLHVPPPEADVMAVAAGAAMPAKVRALHDYLGEKGMALTPKGNLKLADGRALVDLLDTGDDFETTIGEKTFKTQSTTHLRQLMYLLVLFQESGAVRHAGNRLVPVKAWSRKSPVAKATSLFQTVIEFGVLSMMGPRMTFYDDLHGLLDEGVVLWLAGLLAPGASTGFDDIADLNERIVRSQFSSEEVSYYLSEQHLAEDLSRILDMLDATGAIAWTDRGESISRWGRVYWTGGAITMTAFGRHILPNYLPDAGITLRTVPDLTEASVTELISALDSQLAEQHSAILAAWQPSLPAFERAALVADVVAEADDAGTRLVGMRLLGMFDPEAAEPHMRQLLDTAAAGHAAMWLIDHGLADGDTVGAFITPAVVIDILSLLLDHPDALCAQFLSGHNPEGLIDLFWRHPAPETVAVLDVLGRYLPDRALAKQARKAAIKHRSWMANNGH